MCQICFILQRDEIYSSSKVIDKVSWWDGKKPDENVREHEAPWLLIDLKRPLSIRLDVIQIFVPAEIGGSEKKKL